MGRCTNLFFKSKTILLFVFPAFSVNNHSIYIKRTDKMVVYSYCFVSAMYNYISLKQKRFTC